MGNTQSVGLGEPPHMTAGELTGGPPVPGAAGSAIMTSNQPHEQLVGMDGQRIVVDIRGADLDEDDAYQVWVRRHTAPRQWHAGVSQRLLVANAWVQGVLGIAISLLTVGKLWEEIRLLRSVRRELSTLSGSIAGLGPGAGLPGSFPSTGLPFSPASDPSPGGGAGQAKAEASGAAGGGTSGKGAPRSLQEELAASVPLVKGPNKQGNGIGWASISGLDGVKQLLQEVTVLPSLRPDLFTGVRQPPHGVLLFGPPGAGKTMLARAVATESHASFFAITGSSVLSMWYGQSEANVRALFEQARSHQPAVIFIDEVDSLLGKRSGAGGAPGEGGGGTTPDRRVTNEFLAFIDGIQTDAGDAIMVMAATNHPWDLDEAALSRFSRRVYVPLPDRHARAHMLRSTMRGVACNVSPAEYLQLADKCGQYSGRDLMVVCREASMRPLRELWGKRLLTRSGGLEAGGPITEGPAAEREVAAGAGSAGGAGTGPQEQEQVVRSRVVGMLARHLESKRHRKKVRRELTQWCASLGDNVPAWCEVDTLMEEALAQVQAQRAQHAQRSQSAQATPVGQVDGARCPSRAASPVQSTAAQQGGHQEGLSLQQQQELGSSRQQRLSHGGDELGQVCVPLEQQSTGVSTAAAQQQQAAAGSHNTQLAGGSEGDNAGSGQCGTQQEGVALSPTAATACQPCAQVDSHADHVPGVGKDEQQAAAVAGSDAGTQSGCTAATDSRASHSSADPPAEQGKASNGGDAGAPKEGDAPTAARGKRKSHAGPGAPAAAAEASQPSLSLDQLLALPADQVRAVTVKDFEAALQQIMPAELNLTQQYEEFNQRYGSGADVKRTSQAAYLHMYC